MKRTPIQKHRDGPDWTAIIVILLGVIFMLLGVLENIGVINLTKFLGL